jgi:PAS domain-containing protein
MDADFKLLELGPSLAKRIDFQVGDPLTTYFEVQRPFGEFTAAKVVRNQQRLTLLAVLESSLQLRGQLLHLEDANEYLFLGSVKIASMDEIQANGLTIGDFAAHDPVLDFLFLLNQSGSTSTEAQEMIEGLTNQKHIYEAILNNAPNYVFLIDSDHRLVFQNLPLQLVLGSIGIAQPSLASLVPAENYHRVEQDVARCIDGEILAPYELVLERASGEEILLDGRLVPFSVHGLPQMAAGYFIQRESRL